MGEGPWHPALQRKLPPGPGSGPSSASRSHAPGLRRRGGASSRSWALGWGGRALVHVTAAVARYSLLRKTVDHCSHGRTGWQGAVTETSTQQPHTGLAFKETGGLGTRSCPAGAAPRAPLTWRQKGNRGPPHPCRPPQSPRGAHVFEVLSEFFCLVFPGLLSVLSSVRGAASLAAQRSRVSVHSIVCACLWGSPCGL